MRRKNSLYGIAILVLLLVLGVGYAVVSSVGLSINGTAGTLTTNSDLNVVFTNVVNNNSNYVESASFNGTTASFSVKNLSRKGDSVTIGYDVVNNEQDIDATLGDISISNSNSDYFRVTAWYTYPTDVQGAAVWTEFKLDAGVTATVMVNVELIKTPTDVENTDVTISFYANPVAQ